MIKSVMNGLHWGIDIGGTTVIIGYLTSEGFTRVAKLDTEAASGPDSLLNRIAEVIHQTDFSPISIGIGIAGLVDRQAGLLVYSPNLPGWKDFLIRDEVSDMMNCPVAVDNDSNVFAIQAIASSSIPANGLWLMITLGTGIGGTIVQDGSILYGTGYAGEFGHMTVEAGGRKCVCGSTGCWEQYAAAGALRDFYMQRSSQDSLLTPREIAELASTGHYAANSAFREFGKWLGIGLVNLYHCFSPAGVYLAGGLTGAADLFLKSAESEFKSRCHCIWNVNVLPSSSTAGAEGAAITGKIKLK